MISSVQGASSLSTNMLPKMQERMFVRADQNGDGAIDKAELQQLADDMSKRTGMSIDLEASFASMDANGDGQIDATEFPQEAMPRWVLPPRCRRQPRHRPKRAS